MHYSHIDELHPLYHSFGRQSAAKGFSAVPGYISPLHTVLDIEGNSIPINTDDCGGEYIQCASTILYLSIIIMDSNPI